MKFLLIMQVCSALHMSCMDPMEVGIYKTHFEQCAQIVPTQIDEYVCTMSMHSSYKNNCWMNFT